MATFDTPAPISVLLEVVHGEIHLVAAKRADTVVDVQPGDPSRDADVKAAAELRVEYRNGRLLLKTPTALRNKLNPLRGGGAVRVRVELPEDSRVRGGSALASLYSEGRIGECRFETAHSDIQLEETGPVRLRAALGSISVGRARDYVRITNSAGPVRVDHVDGMAIIKNESGETTIGEVTGQLRMTGTNGDIAVERAHSGVEVKTAHGNIRVGEVATGSVELSTAFGEIEVGVRAGTAARLDVTSVTGRVRNLMDATEAPAATEGKVEISARTMSGDVLIQRV